MVMYSCIFFTYECVFYYVLGQRWPNKQVKSNQINVLGTAFTYDLMIKVTLDELRIRDTVISDEEALALYTVEAEPN